MCQAETLKTALEIDIESAARRAVAATIKARARAYGRNPMRLETIFEGLSNTSAETMIAIADHLIEITKAQPHRWWGLGGEAPFLNLKAVKLLGRALRLAQHLEQKIIPHSN